MVELVTPSQLPEAAWARGLRTYYYYSTSVLRGKSWMNPSPSKRNVFPIQPFTCGSTALDCSVTAPAPAFVLLELPARSVGAKSRARSVRQKAFRPRKGR